MQAPVERVPCAVNLPVWLVVAESVPCQRSVHQICFDSRKAFWRAYGKWTQRRRRCAVSPIGIFPERISARCVLVADRFGGVFRNTSGKNFKGLVESYCSFPILQESSGPIQLMDHLIRIIRFPSPEDKWPVMRYVSQGIRQL